MGVNPTSLALLKQHALVVCLWATPEVIWHRVQRQTHRPLIQVPDPQARIRQLLTERTPYYRQADVLITTSNRSLRRVAQLVLHEFQAVRQARPLVSQPI